MSDHKKLCELARAAAEIAPGEWEQGSSRDEDPTAVYWNAQSGVPQSVADCFVRPVAAFIAAANPAAIEALCSRLALLENNLAAYFSARCAHYNGCGDPNYGGKADGTHAWECPVDVAERALRELAVKP